MEHLVANPVRLEVYQDDIHLSNATGLLVESGSSFPLNTYLVTNWHVVSGRHAFTNVPLIKEGSLPNFIRAFFTTKGHREGCQDVYYSDERLRLDIPLYDGDNCSSTNNPTWREHPMGGVCDIAAMDISRDYANLCNDEWDFDWEGVVYRKKGLLHSAVTQHGGLGHLFGSRTRIPLESSLSYDSELVISGFPRIATAPSPIFPLLKRGVVASPPGVPLFHEDKELPAFYADVMTRPGFSGSPVFFRHTNLNLVEVNPYDSSMPTFVPTHATQEYVFVGVYSSRMPEDESKEPIYGICWHYEAVKSVCENVANPRNPSWQN